MRSLSVAASSKSQLHDRHIQILKKPIWQIAESLGMQEFRGIASGFKHEIAP